MLVNPDLENVVSCAEIIKADVFLGGNFAQPVCQREVICVGGKQNSKKRSFHQEREILSLF